jgi:DNA-directed RNA polymerase specialized sigma subunit
MSDELQDRFAKTAARFTNSLTSLSVFTGNKIADLLDRTVDTVERTVNNLTGETSSSSTGTSSGSKGSRTKARTTTTTKTKRTSGRTRTKAAGTGSRTSITDEIQAKIREGFDRGMTTKEIAKFAGVSQSTAVRYTAPLRK